MIQKTHIAQFEQLYQTLFLNHPDGIYLLDLEGKFIIVNEIVSSLTGVPKELLTGNSFETHIQPDYLANTVRHFRACVTEQVPQRYQTCVVARDGIKYVDVTNFPYMVDGNMIAVFGIAKDITALKTKELKYKRNSELLKKRNDELVKMKCIIAHDLRSPLANAMGIASLLDTPATPEKEAKLKVWLQQSLASLDTVIRDLNELAAAKSGEGKELEYLVLSDVITATLHFYEQDIAALGAEVTVEVQQGLSLNTVKAYVQSILRNLIGNALKYRNKAVKPVIRIVASQKGTDVRISVADNGMGMDMEKVGKNLFKMHKRFAPSAADGNGLGLYLVKQQVKDLGGSIKVKSEPGLGSTFIVRLPMNLR